MVVEVSVELRLREASGDEADDVKTFSGRLQEGCLDSLRLHNMLIPFGPLRCDRGDALTQE